VCLKRRGVRDYQMVEEPGHARNTALGKLNVTEQGLSYINQNAELTQQLRASESL